MQDYRIVDIEVRLILEAIYERYGYDFRGYCSSSMRRRVQKVKSDLGLSSFSAVQHELLRDENLFAKILDLLTVTTSDMFRDPEFFLSLRKYVIPFLRTFPRIRIWLAGCSSGEELYSIAITLDEESLLEKTTIHATDINRSALSSAKDGIFSLDRVKGFTKNYLKSGGKNPFSNYYTAAYGAVRMLPYLRRNVVFSEHNLACDDVFGEFHLILCRNVMIYFDRELQNRAVNLFKKSLVYHGYLGIGSKESLAFIESGNAFLGSFQGSGIYRRSSVVGTNVNASSDCLHRERGLRDVYVQT